MFPLGPLEGTFPRWTIRGGFCRAVFTVVPLTFSSLTSQTHQSVRWRRQSTGGGVGLGTALHDGGLEALEVCRRAVTDLCVHRRVQLHRRLAQLVALVLPHGAKTNQFFFRPSVWGGRTVQVGEPSRRELPFSSKFASQSFHTFIR